jgi:hypothetical protein
MTTEVDTAQANTDHTVTYDEKPTIFDLVLATAGHGSLAAAAQKRLGELAMKIMAVIEKETAS